jgi:DNA-directed RNA polymerase specialized sigma24 family protein
LGSSGPSLKSRRIVADPDHQPIERDGIERGNNFLQIAHEAAAARQPERMLEALEASRFLDGLIRRLERLWRGQLPRSEIDQAVACAVDAAYDAVAEGRPVRSLGAWIWKVASNKCCDCWTGEYEHRSSVQTEDLIVQPQRPATEDDDRLSEFRTAEAVRLTRSFLPRIGQGQIVDVLTLVIDAVEQGIEDLPSSAIAETLGLSAGAVRSLMARGFERIEREARRAGITLPEAVPALVGDASEDVNADD